MNRLVVLNDGDVFDKGMHSYFYNFYMNSNIDIFDMYKGNLIIKYVGYIEFVVDGIDYMLYSFPKEYNKLDIVEELDSKNTRLNDNSDIVMYDVNQLDSKCKLFGEMNNVLTSVFRAKNDSRHSSASDELTVYTSKLYYLNEITMHYYEYGILYDDENYYNRTNNGNINWVKTINKTVPQYSNNNFIYDSFIVKKKNDNVSLLSKIVAMVLERETVKYPFYIKCVITDLDYDDIRDYSDEQLLELLFTLKTMTFIDYKLHVIDNLIAYLSDKQTDSNCGVIIGTNNYEYVWEAIVTNGLGSSFKSQMSSKVGNRSNTDKLDDVVIRPDHIDINNKIIVDSKYYKYKASATDNNILDYKQVYYNFYYAQKHYDRKVQLNDIDCYEKNIISWKNVLVRPICDNGIDTVKHFDIAELHHISFHNGMRLYSLYIDMKKYLNWYINGIDSTLLSEINSIEHEVCILINCEME